MISSNWPYNSLSSSSASGRWRGGQQAISTPVLSRLAHMLQHGQNGQQLAEHLQLEAFQLLLWGHDSVDISSSGTARRPGDPSSHLLAEVVTSGSSVPMGDGRMTTGSRGSRLASPPPCETPSPGWRLHSTAHQNHHHALFLMCSSEEMSEDFSDSKIGSSGCLMASVLPSLFMDIASSRAWDRKITWDIGNISSCSNQEELWSSVKTAQSITPRVSFSGDTFWVDTITQEEDFSKEENITKEEAMNEKDIITQKPTITQEESVTEEVTINQGEDITQEATITQEEDMAPEVTMTLDETRTEEVTTADGVIMAQTETLTEEETLTEHEDIIQKATIILEVKMNQLVTLTREDSITQEEAITHGQPEDAGPASTHNQRIPSWKRVKKILVSCFRHLFCCLPPVKRRRTS
ncbi:hypothetical protein I79_023809 [Cricetulus griseus]|uniref:Uncharacterized protein n=1 Tax=Cricetulus griseus TaxID=10029 RepID=G3IIY1_CRIGR|nr:hypothetical protein I79_023809 [Cricetulus griseus]